MTKILMRYKDWLIKTRGKIEPKVGDKYIYWDDEGCKCIHTVKHIDTNVLGNYIVDGDPYLTDCYVEIELPEIEWETLDSHVTIGRINEFDLVKILSYKDKSELYKIQYSTPTCNLPLFEGTLSECKIKANELLWNKI